MPEIMDGCTLFPNVSLDINKKMKRKGKHGNRNHATETETNKQALHRNPLRTYLSNH